MRPITTIFLSRVIGHSPGVNFRTGDLFFSQRSA